MQLLGHPYLQWGLAVPHCWGTTGTGAPMHSMEAAQVPTHIIQHNKRPLEGDPKGLCYPYLRLFIFKRIFNSQHEMLSWHVT